MKNDNFNIVEKSIARTLSQFPFMKKWAKQLYSQVIYIVKKKDYKHSCEHNLVPITSHLSSSFFGYYDKSPVSLDGKFILFHSTDESTTHKPDPQKNIHISLLTSQKSKPVISLSTCAYNWQQGSRTHWLNNDLFIFNDFQKEKNRYVSKVFSKNTLEQVKYFDFPVQDSFNTDYFLSINYSRLMALRPDYGYRNLPHLSKDKLRQYDSDGIWKINYNDSSKVLLYSLERIFKAEQKPIFHSAFHKVNHLMISPKGSSFIFIHRYYINKKRIDRLFFASADGNNIKMLADYGMVSHCFWADNDTILGYLRGPGGKDAYWLINVHTAEFRKLPNNALEGYGDGHPHVYKDWFVTDTYPDKARMQHLLLVNWKTGEVKELGQFFHSFKFNGETRCDLHPRFSPDGKSVFFDSVFDGSRKLYKMDVEL